MEILLHNYPQSPVAEKVRCGFGIKGLSWRSVEIPRLPPKPMLTPLTGGYRRTPVMQIGADIYCDSQCILRELERRFPAPSFFPATTGLPVALSRWSDGELFTLTVKLVLGAPGDALDPAFAEDRGKLYLGPDWSKRLAEAHQDLPHIAAQIRAHFGWLDTCLAEGRDYLSSPDAPGLADALAWHVVWFVRGRWSEGPGFLTQFPALNAWEERIRAIGHGTASDLAPEEALVIARNAEPETPETTDPRDPQGLVPGMRISVIPDRESDMETGEQAVTGYVRSSGRDHVALIREEEGIGTVCVHFPRAGYRIDPLF